MENNTMTKTVMAAACTLLLAATTVMAQMMGSGPGQHMTQQ